MRKIITKFLPYRPDKLFNPLCLHTVNKMKYQPLSASKYCKGKKRVCVNTVIYLNTMTCRYKMISLLQSIFRRSFLQWVITIKFPGNKEIPIVLAVFRFKSNCIQVCSAYNLRIREKTQLQFKLSWDQVFYCWQVVWLCVKEPLWASKLLTYQTGTITITSISSHNVCVRIKWDNSYKSSWHRLCI